jgi:hypothetical protein
MKHKKTKNKQNKYTRIFKKYSQTNEYLTPRQIKKLIKHEFKIAYSSHVFNSFVATWSTMINGKPVFTQSTFIHKLFKQPHGFFRGIQLS